LRANLVDVLYALRPTYEVGKSIDKQKQVKHSASQLSKIFAEGTILISLQICA
jgi:hypothetical protein